MIAHRATTLPVASMKTEMRKRFAQPTATMHVDRSTPDALPTRSAQEACAQINANRAKSFAMVRVSIRSQMRIIVVPMQRVAVTFPVPNSNIALTGSAFCRRAKKPKNRFVRESIKTSASTSMATILITAGHVVRLAPIQKPPKRPDAIKANAPICATITR